MASFQGRMCRCRTFRSALPKRNLVHGISVMSSEARDSDMVSSCRTVPATNDVPLKAQHRLDQAEQLAPTEVHYMGRVVLCG